MNTAMLRAAPVKVLGAALPSAAAWPGGQWTTDADNPALVIALADWAASEQFNSTNDGSHAEVVMNIRAFWGCEESLDYSLALLAASDIDHGVALQQPWLDTLTDAWSSVHLSAPGTDLSVVLANDDELEVNVLQDAQLVPGQRRAVADFFEISLEHDVTERPQARVFTVDGEFTASALAVATGRRLQHSTMWHAEAGLRLLHEIAELPAVLEIAANKVTSMRIGGRERIADLADLTGMEPSGIEVLEVAVGTNRAVLDRIDPHINAQMNEGVLGFHLGIGDGMRGAHLDFLCPHDWLNGDHR